MNVIPTTTMEAVAKQPICDHFLRIHPGIGQIRAEGAAGMGGGRNTFGALAVLQ